MTVLEIISRLEELPEDTRLKIVDEYGNTVYSDFLVDSWRGAYDKPAIVVEPNVETLTIAKEPNAETLITAKEAIDRLNDVDGMVVTGWKGGEFILDEDDTLFLVSDWGNSGNSVTISKISDDGTCYVEEDAY